MHKYTSLKPDENGEIPGNNPKLSYVMLILFIVPATETCYRVLKFASLFGNFDKIYISNLNIWFF